MAFKNWKEYIDERGKIVEKAKVEKIPDYNGNTPAESPKAEIPKQEKSKVAKQLPDAKSGKLAAGAKSILSAGAGAEHSGKYIAGKNAPAKKIDGNGLAEKGDKKLIVKIPEKTDMKVVSSKTKTENFLDKTAGMPLAEFVNYMSNECGMVEHDEADEIPHVTAYAAGKFHPHPPEAINYIASLAVKNERIMDGLIHEIKRQDGLEKLIKAVFDHPESSNTMVSIMDDEEAGPGFAKNIVQSMDNHYGDFLGKQDDMYESVAPPFGMHDEEGEEENQEDDSETDSDDNYDDAPQPQDNDDQDDQKDGEDEESDPLEDSEQESKPKKLKRKFPHDHMMEAMASVPHMREKMSGYCKG